MCSTMFSVTREDDGRPNHWNAKFRGSFLPAFSSASKITSSSVLATTDAKSSRLMILSLSNYNFLSRYTQNREVILLAFKSHSSSAVNPRRPVLGLTAGDRYPDTACSDKVRAKMEPDPQNTPRHALRRKTRCAPNWN